MLARTRDRRESACRWTGYDRDRADARHRIADDRGARRRGAEEPRGLLRPGVARNRNLSSDWRMRAAGARIRGEPPRQGGPFQTAAYQVSLPKKPNRGCCATTTIE